MRWLDGMCSITNYNSSLPGIRLKWLPAKQLMDRNTRRQTEQLGHQRIESPHHGSDVLNVGICIPIDGVLILRLCFVSKCNVEHLSIATGIRNEESPGGKFKGDPESWVLVFEDGFEVGVFVDFREWD